MRILVINGPNLNLLGLREPEIYGSATYEDLVNYIDTAAARLDIIVECFQSNHEGAIIDKIHEAYRRKDGIVINPGGYAHTSIALMDAISSITLPTVEVHISDIMSREEFRHFSYVSKACVKSICGQGIAGYVQALEYLKDNC